MITQMKEAVEVKMDSRNLFFCGYAVNNLLIWC